MTEQEIYKLALAEFGIDSQIDMAIEEMGELIVELLHFRRKRTSNEHVAEEVADAEIMLGQMKMMIGAEIVDRIKAFKLSRIEKRIMECKP